MSRLNDSPPIDAEPGTEAGIPDAGEASAEALRAENERLRAELLAAQAAIPPESPPGRGRRWAAAGLLIACCLGIALSALVLWAHNALLSTDGWTNMVGPVFQDPEVVTAVSEYGAGQLLIALDLEARAAAALPDRMSFLSMPLTLAARQFTAEILERLMSEAAFQELWLGANRQLHERALLVLRGQADRVQIYPDGSVRLNLFPLMDRALGRIEARASGFMGRDRALPRLSNPGDPAASRRELSLALGRELDPDFGEIELAQASRLLRLQNYVRGLDLLALLLPLATLLAAALALLLAADRRRTLLRFGAGTTLALVFAWWLAAWAGGQAAAALPAGVGRVLAGEVVEIALGNLSNWLVFLIVVSLAVAGGAYLAGRPPRLVQAWQRLRGGNGKEGDLLDA